MPERRSDHALDVVGARRNEQRLGDSVHRLMQRQLAAARRTASTGSRVQTTLRPRAPLGERAMWVDTRAVDPFEGDETPDHGVDAFRWYRLTARL